MNLMYPYECLKGPAGDTNGYNELIVNYPLVPMMGYCAFSMFSLACPMILCCGCCMTCILTSGGSSDPDPNEPDSEEEKSKLAQQGQMAMMKGMQDGMQAG